MPEYCRSHLEGGTFFFTVVTYNRLPILTSPEARRLLRAAWENVRERFPFAIDAVYPLPEHIHYNPVKHGVLARGVEWSRSSSHRYVKMDMMRGNGEKRLGRR